MIRRVFCCRGKVPFFVNNVNIKPNCDYSYKIKQKEKLFKMIKKQLKILTLLLLLPLGMKSMPVCPVCDHQCTEECVFEDGKCTHSCIDPHEIHFPEV